MEAAKTGSLNSLHLLLGNVTNGINSDKDAVKTIDFYGRTALYYALRTEHLECAEQLIAAGACISDMVSTAKPYDLVYGKDKEFAVCATRILLQSTNMVESNAVRQAMLLEAIRHGQVECVKIILETATDAKDFQDPKQALLSNWTNVIASKIKQLQDEAQRWIYQEVEKVIINDPLHKCYAAMLRVLYKAGAIIQSADSKLLIQYAFMVSDVEAVAFLLDNDPESRTYATSTEHRSDVLKIVYNGFDKEKSFAIAKLLLDAGAPIRLPNQRCIVPVNTQPLYHAITAMSPECVRALLAAGALQSNDQSSYFDSFTESCIRFDRKPLQEKDAFDVLSQLLEATKKLKHIFYCNCLAAPLRFMCKHGFASCVRLLFEHGAGGIRNLGLQSSLYFDAIRSGNDTSAAEIVNMLAANNVSMDCNHDAGIDYLYYAISNKYLKTVQAIIDAAPVLRRKGESKDVILAMLSVHSLVDPVNSESALLIAEALMDDIWHYGNIGARSLESLFAAQMPVTLKVAVDTLKSALNKSNKEPIMLLRLLIEEFDILQHRELFLRFFTKYGASNLAVTKTLLELGELDLLTPSGLEAFVFKLLM